MQQDQYAWLRDNNWPNVSDTKVLDFLNSHNSKVEAYLNANKQQVEELFEEIKSRIAEDDATVPVAKGDYLYWSFIRKGQEYWTYCRRPKDDDSAEAEVILDINQLAQNQEYCNVAAIGVSPNHQLLAYAVDFNGDERFTIYIKDLASGNIIDNHTCNAFSSFEWSADSKGIYYLPANEFWRADKLCYHHLGAPKSDDSLILSEDDPSFRIAIHKSESERYIVVYVSSSNENDVLLIDQEHDFKTIQTFAKRQPNRKIYLSHHLEHFYFLTNDTGRNFRLVQAPISSFQDWQELIPADSNIYLEELHCFQNYLCLQSKELGLTQLKVYDYQLQLLHQVQFSAPSYQAAIIFTTYDASSLRYSYSALNQPQTIYELDFTAFETTLRKQTVIPCGFNSADYVVERIFAPSREGDDIQIPISLVYNKSLVSKGTAAPLYLYGYGSYGYAIPAGFRGTIVSLLDRGFIYAIAHIRGGDDLGYDWYESAKFLNKKRTFNDFIDCAQYLCNQGYSHPGDIVIAGGSAGGMLVGACMNMRPELFKAVVAHVPFVDVLNTMLDESLPLTPGEFNEWGNPKQKEYYDYIMSYSPYDNIEAKQYPALFVTAGLSDPRVTYWEPAKWVAKLQELKTDDNPILLKTNMGAGHAGKTGRFEHLREYAEEFCFVLDQFLGPQGTA